ncbi:MAG: alpha/beta hydrolase domain-containing protein [Terriglobia bacterium]
MISGAAFLFCAAFCATAGARVTRVVVEERDSPAFTRRSFGPAGAYETLSGHFFGELDPKDPHNVIVTDIETAPRNARGLVEYSATFAISRPVNPAKASGVLIYSVPNRGGGSTAGSEFGHISVVSGWQGDLTPRAGLQTITVPATSHTGPVVERFINVPAGSHTLPIGTAQYVALTYQRPVTLDTSKATLTKRASDTDAGALVPSTDWAFADCTNTPFPGAPDPSKICMKNAFDTAFAYDLVFTAKDPLVLGIGYAATRDLISFLRYGVEGNPLAGQVKWAIGQGNSQSGNFIRSFIHLGFNQDEDRRMVWDGVNPHIAARQLAMNYRFAVPGGAAGPFEPGSEAVLWWGDYPDKARHRETAGMLDRCKASNTCPKVMETFGALEFWYLRESPNLVGTDAKADIPLPANVRRYFLPGTPHGGGRGGFSLETPPAAGCVLASNPNPEADTMRALMVALVDWVSKGTEPPPSHYPRLDRGELTDPAKLTAFFKTVPGAPVPAPNPFYDYDYGNGFRYNDLSGVVTKEPPAVRLILPLLVPQIDADGSDVGGVPSVLRQVPLGSYLGWNVTASGYNKGKACGLAGGYIPFARTKAQRLASGDPRLSLEERYRNHNAYVTAVKAAAAQAVRERFLLPEDAARLIREASANPL